MSNLHSGYDDRMSTSGTSAVGIPDVAAIVADLRERRGDTASIEVKSGAHGYPRSLLQSLCALANLPGGGVVIIGLDEATGFHPVTIPDPHAYEQALADQARALEPPAVVTVDQVRCEGHTLVVGVVAECDPAAKPCRVRSSGKAYIRSHDGDYVMSALEEQGFWRLRTAPHVDGLPVPGATADDLDPALLDAWRATVRRRDREGLGRFDDAEMPIRAGVLTRDGVPTKAGLLSVGRYPQQFFPRCVVKVADMRDVDPTERARNSRTFTGSVGVMLSETLAWLRVTIGSRTLAFPDGSVREVPLYPLIALRELVANALVHRDLDAWSEGQAVELRVHPTSVEITNPGGLYGVTVDRLGAVEFTHARNQVLVGLCENVTSPDGTRVVEALASGLTTVARELRAYGLPPARYFDTGVAFTAILRLSGRTHEPRPAASDSSARTPRAGTNQRAVLDAVAKDPGSSVTQLSQATGLGPRAVRTALEALRAPGRRLVLADGGPGRLTTYRVSG